MKHYSFTVGDFNDPVCLGFLIQAQSHIDAIVTGKEYVEQLKCLPGGVSFPQPLLNDKGVIYYGAISIPDNYIWYCKEINLNDEVQESKKYNPDPAATKGY